jgi:hypothetical protein
MRLRSLSNPYVAGGAIGFLMAFGIILFAIWIPSLGDERSKWWLNLAFFSVCTFSILISGNWRHRRRSRFWWSVAILAGIHLAATLLFINQVRLLTVRGYVGILFLEVFFGSLFVSSFVDGRAAQP